VRVGVGVWVFVGAGVAVGAANGEPLQADNASASNVTMRTVICNCLGNMEVFPFPSFVKAQLYINCFYGACP